MSDRAQLSKSVAYVLTGKDDTVKVSKVVAYFWLVPSDEVAGVRGQGHVHTQLITRS
jgi:hypothetical protein